MTHTVITRPLLRCNARHVSLTLQLTIIWETYPIDSIRWFCWRNRDSSSRSLHAQQLFTSCLTCYFGKHDQLHPKVLSSHEPYPSLSSGALSFSLVRVMLAFCNRLRDYVCNISDRNDGPSTPTGVPCTIDKRLTSEMFGRKKVSDAKLEVTVTVALCAVKVPVFSTPLT